MRRETVVLNIGEGLFLLLERAQAPALFEPNALPAKRAPRVGLIEILPVAMLLLLCVALTVGAGPAMAYLQSAAERLHIPADYLQGVVSTPAGGAGR